MIYSMTGYGESITRGESFTVNTSIRTVNHRYLEIRIRGLEDFRKLEAKSEKLLKSYFKRGRLDAQVELSTNSGQENLDYNLEKAKKYYQALLSLAKELKLDERPHLSHIIRLGDVFNGKSLDEAQIWPLLNDSLSESAACVQAARKEEGEALRKDLSIRTEELKNHLKKIEEMAPQVKKKYKEKLNKRVGELLEDEVREIDGARLEEEAILFAERSDIAEEITRLYSHLKTFQALIKNEESGEEPVGNTLDFLAQEMQREVNTVGSKAGDVIIKEKSVKMKSQIKKIREQVRNIE